jgi:hypothetical protein
MGSQISSGILSRNLSGSTYILRGEGLKINFPVAQVVHIKSDDLGNFASIKLSKIFIIDLFLDVEGIHAKS